MPTLGDALSETEREKLGATKEALPSKEPIAPPARPVARPRTPTPQGRTPIVRDEQIREAIKAGDVVTLRRFHDVITRDRNDVEGQIRRYREDVALEKRPENQQWLSRAMLASQLKSNQLKGIAETLTRYGGADASLDTRISTLEKIVKELRDSFGAYVMMTPEQQAQMRLSVGIEVLKDIQKENAQIIPKKEGRRG